MPREALFVFPSPHGHVTPNLPVLAELVRRGWHVRAFAAEPSAAAITATGAEHLSYDPPLLPPPALVGMTNEKWSEEAPDHFLGVIKAAAGVVALAERDRPDVIAFDSSMWAPARVAAARAGAAAVQLLPILINTEPFTPESVREGEPDPEAERAGLASFAEILSSLFEEHGLVGATAEEFAASPGEQRIVYVPREFHPDGERYGEEYTFAGPGLPALPAEPTWTPPPGSPPLLLLSLGTTSNDRLDLFTGCIAAFADSPWHVVITLGGRIKPEELGPLPPNVEAHQWIPHAEVLSHATAYVSNAGVSSLMEALALAVPIVAVPSHVEAVTNSARLTELGLGRTLLPESANGATVREAVEAVAADPGVRAALAAMREAIERAGGPAVSADVFDAQVGARATAG